MNTIIQPTADYPSAPLPVENASGLSRSLPTHVWKGFGFVPNLRAAFTVLAATLLGSLPACAQERARVSPHETVTMAYGNNHVKIVYGRPYSKNPKGGEPRKIWGGLVPYDKVWRTGADEATLLTTEQTLDIQGTTIPVGTYSLYTLPTPEGGKLIVNKETGQWGTKYDESKDLARIDLKKTGTDHPYDQFTILLEKNDKSPDPTTGYIAMRWEDTEYYVEIASKK